jgi:hypothetical protein
MAGSLDAQSKLEAKRHEIEKWKGTFNHLIGIHTYMIARHLIFMNKADAQTTLSLTIPTLIEALRKLAHIL